MKDNDGKGYQAASDSELGPPTLVKIPLDLQILICTLLHPSDILALRETCKTLQLITRRRVVWVAALYRVCLDNSLFLPSFPILDMSDVELEHAAMGPRRWIKLYASFEKQHPHGSCVTIRPRTTRIIEDSSLAAVDRPELFIVPGGRYVVSWSPKGIFVWDLGYTSGADCKLIASVGPEGGSYECMVQATPDGMGLVILSCRSYEYCSVYEIYPQSETPRLTHIIHLDFDPTKDPPAYLLPDRVLWYAFYEDMIVFRVWDYRMNHSISFAADFDVEKFEYNLEVIATKTAIFVLCAEEILVWAIPPLLPQPPDFFDHNPTHIPPLFGITFPDRTVSHSELVGWQTLSPWYFGSSQPLYFDILCQGSKIHRFEIIVNCNLFHTSLHLINTEFVAHDFDYVDFQSYSICEDTLVASWGCDDPEQCGAYTGLTSSRFTTIIPHGGTAAKMLFPSSASAPAFTFFLSPTSGRYTYVEYIDDGTCRIVVHDLF